MKRPLPQRVHALLGAILFLLSGAGDAFGVHVCPFHDMAPRAHGSEGAPAADAEAGPHDHHHGAPTSPDDGHALCTCPAACPTGVVGAVPVEDALTLDVRVVATPLIVVPQGDVRLLSFTAFLFPDAQPPPLIS